METPRPREVPLVEVDLDNHPFRVPPAVDLDRLKESLSAVGLLSFPRLQPRPQGGLKPVCGWLRLKAAAELGWPRVPAVILAGDVPEPPCLLLYLHDNAFSRPFNPLERAILASRLLAHWDRETVMRQLLPLMGLPPAPAHLDRLLAVSGLPEPWRDLVAQERLAVTAAARLAAWEPEDRRAAFPFLAHLPLSQSKQEEFVEGVELLARRQGVTPAGVLAAPELRQLLQNAAWAPQEQAEKVRRLLLERLAPRFGAARQAFKAALVRLGLGRHPRLSLKEPPAFEGADFELTVRFKDGAELRRLLEELAGLAGRPEFEDLSRL